MSKIKLEAGMQVSCIINGIGTIEDCTEDGSIYPIGVDFPNHFITFTRDGKENERYANPTLKLLNIPFTEGLEVECDIYGKGVVTGFGWITSNHCVRVSFSNGFEALYTSDGRIDARANQTLFPQFTI